MERLERRHPFVIHFRPRDGADSLNWLRLYTADQITTGHAEADCRAILAREYPGASDIHPGTPEEAAKLYDLAKPPTARP